MNPRVEFVVEIRTENPQNRQRGTTRLAAIIASDKGRRHRASARIAAVGAMHAARVSRVDLIPARIIITRVSSGHMDTDGLAASQKRVRDGIADALGVDDGSSAVEWVYRQERGKQKRHFVKVAIEKREMSCARIPSA